MTGFNMQSSADPFREDRGDLPQPRAQPTVLTIGHSTRPIGSFTDLLRAHQVRRLVDVRTVPRSRHNPQFNREALAAVLADGNIDYTHMPELGGFRKPAADSTNLGWRNASFRGYADYMQTAAFAQSLDALIALATVQRTAIMCAEAVPWRCHRSLIADALLAHGVRSDEIVSATRLAPHALTAFAAVDGDKITYPIKDQLF